MGRNSYVYHDFRGGYRIMKHTILVFEIEKECMRRGRSLDRYFGEFRRKKSGHYES